jgi:hypothetical protein
VRVRAAAHARQHPGGFSLASAERRADQYALVGAYLARHCQVLIALWNGVAVMGAGGTADVVRYRREEIPDRYQDVLARVGGRSALDPVESGPLFHVLTPRRDHAGIEGEPLTIRQLPVAGDPLPIKTDLPPATGNGQPATGSEAIFERVCENIEAFNENALLLAAEPALREARGRNAGYLLPDADAASLPPGLRALREQYATADALAQHFQRLTFQTLSRLCVLVCAAVLSFELSAKLLPDSGLAALLFPVMLGATYLYWGATVRRGRWQDRYQDYRALAEGLRVQFYWSLAGLPASVALGGEKSNNPVVSPWGCVRLRWTGSGSGSGTCPMTCCVVRIA